MREYLERCEMFAGLAPDDLSLLAGFAKRVTLENGQYLFLLGDPADRLFVICTGQIETCFPIFISGSMRDIAVETRGPGDALGWSTFVRPHRFTLSARAKGPVDVLALPRTEIDRVTSENPQLGCRLTARISDMLGRRLLTMQALWVRELQRAVRQGHVAGGSLAATPLSREDAP